VNVHVRRFSPPLEQTPDQIASRPLVTLRVIDVPRLNVALPVVPTGTLMPDGFESTRSPLRPDALTVRAAVAPGGFTVSTADFVTPLYVAKTVTALDVLTADVVAENAALAAPAGMVMLVGTLTTDVWLLASATTAPPAGAADVSVTAPADGVPPVTLDGLSETADSDAGAGAVVVCGVKRRTDENGPATPAELRARTRHPSRCAGKPLSVACEVVTVAFATKGELIVDELSSCTS